MTGELKKALESAQTDEEKKAVVEKFKDQLKELSPEELEGVAGGLGTPDWEIAIGYKLKQMSPEELSDFFK